MATKTAKFGNYLITIEESGSITVTNDDSNCSNTKEALRDIADKCNFNFDPNWNTRQFGKKLVEHLNAQTNADEKVNQNTNLIDILNQKYDKVFDDGPIYTVRLDDKYGFVDRDGNELIPPRYDWLGDEFCDGVIVAGLDNGGMGFVNDNGVEIVAPIYDSVSGFQKGTASVCLNGKWGMIDKTGKEIIKPKYDYIFHFEGEEAKVKLDGKTLFIDRNGNETKVFNIEIIGDEYEYGGIDADDEWGDTYGGLACDSPDDITISINGEEISDEDVLENIEYQMLNLPSEKVHLDSDNIGIVKHTNKASYSCTIKLSEELDPNKLILNVGEYVLDIDGKIWSDETPILFSISYDGTVYPLDFDWSDNLDTERYYLDND